MNQHSYQRNKGGKVLKKLWGVIQDNLVLSTEWIMYIGHRKEGRKLAASSSSSSS